MLTLNKKITLNGTSMIDGVAVEGYTAQIDSENPENMTITSFPHNKALLKENRVQCRQDEAEFEDMAYALQDELIAAKEVAE